MTERRIPGALAGVVAASAWVAAEPVARRLFGTPYTDVRLLGRAVSRRHWRAAGIAAHLANGAAAGAAFERAGLRGWRAGLVVFQIEGIAAWPLMLAVDRWHPDRSTAAPGRRSPETSGSSARKRPSTRSSGSFWDCSSRARLPILNRL
jgi:hypothetical protein